MRPRFAIDVNVGRLAKWLRGMGYDALYLPNVDDGELLRIARSEGRVIITRDRRILERRLVTRGIVKVFLVESDDFREQMREVAAAFGLDLRNGFSLCIECNARLTSVARERVRERVPPYVYENQEQFFECVRCGKLYWRGTHWRNMRAELAAIVGESDA
ncbi:MAG: Mut7-C RNAse domain-containing protein [Chloroflexi bacterium]|nr:Mut7-C RNAse domain-containing protein [Chloroflexota bacterium]